MRLIPEVSFGTIRMVYWVGLIAHSALVVLVYNQPHPTNAAQYFVTGFGVAHILILGLLGYGVANKIVIATAGKIQTAGYIHMLIGLSAALIQGHLWGTEALALDRVLPLTAMALVTSVVGWSIGEDVSTHRKPSTAQPLSPEEFSRSTTELLGDFAETLHAGIAALQTATGLQTQLNTQAAEHWVGVIDSMQTVRVESEKIASPLADAVQVLTSKELDSHMKQLKVNIDNFNAVVQQGDILVQNLLSISKTVAKEMELRS